MTGPPATLKAARRSMISRQERTDAAIGANKNLQNYKHSDSPSNIVRPAPPERRSVTRIRKKPTVFNLMPADAITVTCVINLKTHSWSGPAAH